MKKKFFAFSLFYLLLNLGANASSPIIDYLIDIEIQNKQSGLSPIDCIYVINLESRPHKWSQTYQILLQYDIYPNRVNAINGWQLSELDKAILFGPYSPYSSKLNGGQIGCLLSHVSIVRDALNRRFKYIWVCEDDIKIHEDPHQLTAYIDSLNAIEPEWDIFYTDIDTKNSTGKRVRSLSLDFRADQQHQSLSYYIQRTFLTKDISTLRQRYGAYSMIISHRGIEKIFNYFSNIYLWTAYDVDLHYIPNIKQFALNKDLVSIDYTSPSDTIKN